MIRERRGALALAVSFFVLYAGIGITLHARAPRLFTRLDLAFDADVPSRIIDLTRVGGAHYRTQLHPLFVLLLNPLGLLLRAGLRGLGIEPSGRLAAILLTSAAGATGVGLVFAWLRRVQVSGSRSWLWALLFGLSSSQMVFSVLPETFVFSALSLVAAFFFLSVAERCWALRLAAAVACFGMALSNLGAVFLARADALWRKEGRAFALFGGARLVGATLAATALLAAVQLWIYPRTVPFYSWSGVASGDQSSFYRPTALGPTLAHAGNVGANLFLFNFAAARLEVQGAGTEYPTVDFRDASWGALRPAGVAHLLPWTLLLAVAACGLFVTRHDWNPPVRGVAFWFLTNAALHSVFGVSLFLYSCQWTFALVVLAALGAEAWLLDVASRRRIVLSALILAVGLEAAANGMLFAELVSVFG